MVNLQAVVALNTDGFKNGLSSMSAAVSNVTGAMMAAFSPVSAEVLALGKAFGGVGVAIGILKEVSSVGMTAEQAMADLKVQTGFSADTLKMLSGEASNLSTKMTQSMPEIIGAMQNLHSAGANTAEQIQQVLVPALQLARLSGLDMATAADGLVKTLNMFGMSAQDAGKMLDIMIAAVDTGDVAEFTQAMMAAGTVAGALGISMQETAAVLSIFEKNQVEGAAAGKAFVQVLTKLSEEAKNGKGELGAALAGWTASGEGISGALDRMTKAGLNADQIFAEFTGKTKTSILALFKEGGPAVDALAASCNQLGIGAEKTAVKNATLAAQLKILGNVTENLNTTAFLPMAIALANIVIQIQEVVKWFGKLTAAALGGDWSTVKTMLVGVFDSALASARKSFDGIREGAGKIADAFAKIDWGKTWETLKTTAESMWKSVETFASTAMTKIGAYLKAQDWEKVWEAVKTGAIKAFEFWYLDVTIVTNKIAEFMKTIDGAKLWEGIKTASAVVWKEIQDIATRIWPTIENIAKNSWSIISDTARIAWEAIQKAVEKIDWNKSFSKIEAASSNAWSAASKAVSDWMNRTMAAFQGFDWGKIGSGIMAAIIAVRDSIVTKFNELVSGNIITDIFTRIGNAIGGALRASLQVIGATIGTMFADIESGNYKARFLQFWTDVMIGGMKAISGLFTGILEGLFGKHVVDNVVVGAELMMLDIKQAIQSKIGDILNAFNLLMAGIITKTSEGAARVAEVFGFEGMAEKIRAKSAEFSAAFSSGTNGMIEAAAKTGEEIKDLEDYINTLNAPTVEAGKSIAKLGIDTDKTSFNFADWYANLFKITPALDGIATSTQSATGAISKLAAAAGAIGPIMGEYMDKIDTEDMADNLKAMGAAASGTAKQVKELADATKETKVSVTDLIGMLAAFKGGKISAFDVSDFVDAMKRLQTGLAGFKLPEIKLPDFSLFKIPRINTMEMAGFVNSMKQLATGLAGIVFPDMTRLTDLAFITIPNLSRGAITDLLHNLGLLKNGLMDIDFGSLGNINVDIKGSGGGKTITDVYNLLANAKGIVWA